MEANTIDLRDVHFPGGSEVMLRSRDGIPNFYGPNTSTLMILTNLSMLTFIPILTPMADKPSLRENSFRKPTEWMGIIHRISKPLLEMLPLKFGHFQTPNNLLS